MTRPRQPRTRSHPINARTLTGVCQAVRMFSPCQFHVYAMHGAQHYVVDLIYPFKLLISFHSGMAEFIGIGSPRPTDKISLDRIVARDGSRL